ncbi:MAG: hypothetical protein WD771_06045 [Gemmatimonadaceae bacterium]
MRPTARPKIAPPASVSGVPGSSSVAAMAYASTKAGAAHGTARAARTASPIRAGSA